MISRTVKVMVVCVAWAGLPAGLLANSAPVVSNVTASQRPDNSKLVDIRYTLTDADGDSCTVWVTASDNGGATWKIPVRTFWGQVGANVPPGSNKLVTWDAGQDIPGKVGSLRVRVWADDGKGSCPMVFVAAGSFPYQKAGPGGWVSVSSFLIDKYEVTNHSYCEFLNQADPTASHWDANMEITRSGNSGSYSYAVLAGRENHPIRYVTYNDACAYASWRSARDGVTYRLPTEQEWEKAAAWDPVEQHYYTYGFHRDSIDCSYCVYNSCFGSGPMRVGYLDGTDGRNDAKSYYGCYDMAGNVWEWTSSWYTVDQYRVIRGGFWYSIASGCACSIRGNYTPSSRNDDLGFRLVLDLD